MAELFYDSISEYFKYFLHLLGIVAGKILQQICCCLLALFLCTTLECQTKVPVWICDVI